MLMYGEVTVRSMGPVAYFMELALGDSFGHDS